jgi:anaerobic ribonucleoside-triphosphate reductase
MKLDASCWIRVCPDCHEEVGGEWDSSQDDCPKCGSKEIEHFYHARILERKTLEDKK